MAAYFSKGIVLEQNKEPALSREIKYFLTDETPTLIAHEPSPTPQWEEILQIAEEAGIVDESDGRSLAEKLRSARERELRTIVADAMDDEPYISSQLGPTLQLSDQLADGLALAVTAVGATDSYLAIYKHLTDVEFKIPQEVAGIRVERIQGSYPAEYRSKKFYQSKSQLVVGSCALIHLHRAVRERRRQTTCFVTVAGDCIGNPCNLEVTLGMTLQQVLERCGLIEEPRRVVVGGSMTGYSVTDTQATTVNAATRGILAFKENFKEMNYTCIGCGRCAKACPEDLNPYYLYKFVTSHRYKELQGLDIDLCTGCGTCSYVCPAKLDIARVLAQGKRDYLAYQSRNREKEETPLLEKEAAQ